MNPGSRQFWNIFEFLIIHRYPWLWRSSSSPLPHQSILASIFFAHSNLYFKHSIICAEALDMAVFSLSLMSTNWTDYIREARRCLTDKGYLMIAEISRSLSAEGSLYTNDEGRLFKLKDVLREEGDSFCPHRSQKCLFRYRSLSYHTFRQ
jgi:hypothetical protein